jgi:uncharacterized protein (DUF1778 family)
MATDASPQNIRNATVNLRLQAAARDLIDRAAAMTGKSRTEFMVEASRREAESILLDRCYFALVDKAFVKLAKALDQSPKENQKLRKLLRTPAFWD